MNRGKKINIKRTYAIEVYCCVNSLAYVINAVRVFFVRFSDRSVSVRPVDSPRNPDNRSKSERNGGNGFNGFPKWDRRRCVCDQMISTGTQPYNRKTVRLLFSFTARPAERYGAFCFSSEFTKRFSGNPASQFRSYFPHAHPSRVVSRRVFVIIIDGLVRFVRSHGLGLSTRGVSQLVNNVSLSRTTDRSGKKSGGRGRRRRRCFFVVPCEINYAVEGSAYGPLLEIIFDIYYTYFRQQKHTSPSIYGCVYIYIYILRNTVQGRKTYSTVMQVYTIIRNTPFSERFSSSAFQRRVHSQRCNLEKPFRLWKYSTSCLKYHWQFLRITREILRFSKPNFIPPTTRYAVPPNGVCRPVNILFNIDFFPVIFCHILFAHRVFHFILFLKSCSYVILHYFVSFL